MNDPEALRLSPVLLAIELARPWLLFILYLVVCARGWWLIALPLAVGCFLAAFVQLHDAMHGALWLPRRMNDVVIAASGLLLLKAGHGLRATHLRHHSRPLAHDDPEGRVVHWPFWRVVLAGPFHILGMRGNALVLAPRTAREQLSENAATLALAIVAMVLAWRGDPAGLIYCGVAALMTSTMAIWAAYIPHSLSSRQFFVRAAAWASRAWTPVLNSFAYHHLHHRYAKVPTILLPQLARAVGPEIALADETLHLGTKRS